MAFAGKNQKENQSDGLPRLSSHWCQKLQVTVLDQSEATQRSRLTMRSNGRLPRTVFGAVLKVGVAANAAELKR